MSITTISSDVSPPGWLQAALKLGVPAVIALGLVFWLTQIVSSDMRTLSSEVRATQRSVDEHVNTTREHQIRMEVWAQQTCENTARTDLQRVGCRLPSSGGAR